MSMVVFQQGDQQEWEGAKEKVLGDEEDQSMYMKIA
jgi:hypothetical protein